MELASSVFVVLFLFLLIAIHSSLYQLILLENNIQTSASIPQVGVERDPCPELWTKDRDRCVSPSGHSVTAVTQSISDPNSKRITLTPVNAVTDYNYNLGTKDVDNKYTLVFAPDLRIDADITANTILLPVANLSECQLYTFAHNNKIRWKNLQNTCS